ncbi:hypothetical protein ABZS77_01010 [Micromonospora sp. NPDC005298]|uniref:hypothetical protein n=1 Tax=Micromonospora sp. NPDC005298 TaxID=3156873 RepID=UPI0033B9083A
MSPRSAGGARPKTSPALPLSLLLPSALMVLAGATDDREPPPPAGLLTTATVIATEPAHRAQDAYVLVRVDTADGPTICAIGSRAFHDRRLPPLSHELTVDYTATGCAPAPVNGEIPRWAIIAMGAGGFAMSIFWLWAGPRLGRLDRWRRRRRR